MTDSDEEPILIKKRINKANLLLDSDDETSDDTLPCVEGLSVVSSNLISDDLLPKRLNNDVETSPKMSHDHSIMNVFKANPDLYDSGHSDSDSNINTHVDSNTDNEISDGEEVTQIEKSGSKHPLPLKSLSGKQRLNVLNEIRSESQRIFRQSRVSLPYHKPAQQRSLDEFLDRKKGVSDVASMTLLRIKCQNEIDSVQAQREKISQEFYHSKPELSDLPLSDNNCSEEKNNNHMDNRKEEAIVEICPNNNTDVADTSNIDTGNGRAVDSDTFSMPCLNLTSDNDLNNDANKKDVELIVDKNEDGLQKIHSNRWSTMGLDLSLLSVPKLSRKPLNSDEMMLLADSDEMNHFKNRFVRHVKADVTPLRTSFDLSIVRKDIDCEGNEKLIAENMVYDTKEMDVAPHDFKKPGVQYISLKKKLKEKMDEKRRLEWNEREKVQKQCDNDDEEIESFDADYVSEGEDDDESESSEGEEEPIEDDYKIKDRELTRCEFVEDEALDEDDDDASDVESDYKSDTETFKHGRIDRKLSNTLNSSLSSEDEDDSQIPMVNNSPVVNKVASSLLDRQKGTPSSDGSFFMQVMNNAPRLTPFNERSLSPPHPLPQIEIDQNGARKKLGFEGLFDDTDPQVYDIGDVLELCSGQFLKNRSTSPSSLANVVESSLGSTVMASVPNSETCKDISISNDLVCFSMSPVDDDSKILITSEPSLLVSDDDDSLDLHPNHSTTEIKVRRRKRKNIVFSDDEDDNDGDIETDEIPNDKEYDSEENEIHVQNPSKLFDKHGRILSEFVEEEAELSGSDVGSEDENEEGLDQLEFNDADEEQLDENQIRDELGRIHHRKMLDFDKQDVQLFQEAFLEDGDLHSDHGRQRSFRWINIDDDDASNHYGRSDSDFENEDEPHEEDEKRRKEVIEREKWILDESSKLEDNDSIVSEEIYLHLSGGLKRQSRMSLDRSLQKNIYEFKSSDQNQTPNNVETRNRISMTDRTCRQRGSFLTRSAALLGRIADMTKNSGSSSSGLKGSNFVFSTKEKKHEDEQAEINQKHSKEPEKKKLRNMSMGSADNTIFAFM